MIVLPDGPEDAEVVVIGEAPGKDEDRIGKPFMGASGNLLFGDIFAKAGILRKDCLVMNVHWERPPGNDFTKLSDQHKYEEENWKIIKQHPRKVIIAVGELALQFTSNYQFIGITKYRGSILRTETSPCAFVPMIHPAALFRNYSWKALCRMDAIRAKAVWDEPNLEDKTRDIETIYTLGRENDGGKNESFEAFRDALAKMENAACVAFDIETYNRTTTCIGMADSDQHAVVVPCTGEFSRDQTTELLQCTKRVLEGPGFKIGQNLDYDVQYLFKNFNIGVRNVWLDTMVAHSVLHPEMSHSLDLLASIYTLQPYYKDMRKESINPNPSKVRDEYNGIDCCVTFEVGMRLYEELHRSKCRTFFEAVAMPVTRTLVRMEHQGVRTDEELRAARITEIESALEKEFEKPVLEGVNPNSPKQVLEWLAEHKAKPTSRGKQTSDVHALKLLRNRRPDLAPFIGAVLSVREKRKTVSTYLRAEASPEGRMHTSYRTSSTDTGRISSSKDVFGRGMNLQNVPIEQRDWFKPDVGLVFWASDANQIEARITAWVSGDQHYIEAYLEGRDIHTENASKLFHIDPSQVGKPIIGSQYTYRDVGKRATHAMNYMVGAGKLKELMNEYVPELPFSLQQSKDFIDTFKRQRPKLVQWWGQIINHLRQDRKIITPFGRQRIFLDRWGDQLHRAAVAFIPQSTAADHINSALVRIEARLEDIPDANVLLQVHDEIAGQCRPEVLPEVEAIVIEEMEKKLPLDWHGEPLVVPAEFKSGQNWKECK